LPPPAIISTMLFELSNPVGTVQLLPLVRTTNPELPLTEARRLAAEITPTGTRGRRS
jgi:hypothetical protein